MADLWTWPVVRQVFFETIAKLYGYDSYGKRRIPRWDGGYDKFGRFHRCVWKRIAEFLNKVNCSDLPSYIKFACQFYCRRVYPNQLYSQDLWQKYLEFRKFKLRELQLELIATGLLTTFWKDHCSPDEVKSLVRSVGPSLLSD